MATDILLINPFSWTRDGRASYLPYGILYLASYLRKRKVNVNIVDCNTRDNVMQIIKAQKPDMIGLSVLTGPVINDALIISREAKKICNPLVIWGGLHPTLFPKIVRQEQSVDCIIRGEGEEALYRLINGMNFTCIYDNQSLIDLNQEAMPAWDLLPDMNKYIMNKHYGDRVLTLNTSRGCVNDCAFCFNNAMKTHKWRALSAENIFKQVMHLALEYDINGIQFYEDNFDVDKERVKKFCELMIKSRLNKTIKWAHFSCVKKADPELIRYEREAGCREIGYGVESGSNRILELLNKKQNTKDIQRAFDICREQGMKATALFMIGLPTETEDDLYCTQSLIKKLHSYQDICTIYRPYPKTKLHDMCHIPEPTTLEAQADFYGYGKLDEKIRNVSEVDTAQLQFIQRHYYQNTLMKELWHCIKDFNIKRLRYLIMEGLKYASRNLFRKGA
jgi:anaerobic magnesium-protoporphyrin IX monomethyl ester cyclase